MAPRLGQALLPLSALGDELIQAPSSPLGLGETAGQRLGVPRLARLPQAAHGLGKLRPCLGELSHHGPVVGVRRLEEPVHARESEEAYEASRDGDQGEEAQAEEESSADPEVPEAGHHPPGPAGSNGTMLLMFTLRSAD